MGGGADWAGVRERRAWAEERREWPARLLAGQSTGEWARAGLGKKVWAGFGFVFLFLFYFLFFFKLTHTNYLNSNQI